MKKPIGNKKTFITTLTGLCVYSATVAFTYSRATNHPDRSEFSLLFWILMLGTYHDHPSLTPVSNPCHVGSSDESESFTLSTMDTDPPFRLNIIRTVSVHPFSLRQDAAKSTWGFEFFNTFQPRTGKKVFP